jgi:hypothetical protein
MPAPKNELSMCTTDYKVIGPDSVVFSIDLRTHTHLNDALLVQRCMDEYMDFYTKVYFWQAQAQGGILRILVRGDLNPVA